MMHDIEQQFSQQTEQPKHDAFVLRLRAYLSAMPDVRLAFYQPGPQDESLCLAGPDHARVVLSFTRNVSSEHAGRRLAKVKRHFASSLGDSVEFCDIERLDYRDACEVAFNGQTIYGPPESVERDRMYRYNVFLEWNAGKKMTGVKQDTPPVLLPSLNRSLRVVEVERFITPIYRHLKLTESHLRELRALTRMGLNEFAADKSAKSLTESYMLKAIQSTILITMSVMHRTMRLAARDYRDLFLLMPVFGMSNRERASKLARCADIRDRLMFKYEEVTATEVYQQAQDVIETLADFKVFMLEWVFEHYYGASGELIQSE